MIRQITASGETRYNKWQRMITTGKTSGNEWQLMTAMNDELQGMRGSGHFG